VSKPIEGRFGIAIVKVESVEPATQKPFEEVSADLKKEIAAQRAKNEMVNVQEKVEDERLGGASLTDAAKKFGLTPRTIDAIDRTGKDPKGNPVPDLPQNADVLSAAFATDVHGENEPIKVANNGGFVWYDVDQITKSRDRPLDEVKEDVLKHWRDDQITERLRKKSAEMVDKIKGGTSFNDVIATDKLKSEWRPGIKRGTVPQGLSAVAVADIFKTPKDGSGTAEGATPTERIVFHVTEVKVLPLDPQNADAKRLDEALKARATEDLIAQYLTKIQAEIGVSINQNALDQVSGSQQNN
jgi:peptidyl-prolyl cis-trans isomerase D